METYEEARAAVLRNLGQELLTDRWQERLRFKLTGHWSEAVVEQRLLVSDLMHLRARHEFDALLEKQGS